MAEAFTFEGEFKLTDEMYKKYHEDGFIVIRNFADKEEVGQILKALEGPDGMLNHSYTALEEGNKEIVRIVYDNPGSDVSGILSRSKKVVDSCEQTSEAGDKKILRVMYQHPGNDVSGIVSRSKKVVDSCEKLLGGEVYHYHGKFILKNPHEAGGHVWHQDYGYWYDNNLFPDMITVWLPLDKATKKNSCLQVLKGSHKCGRIDHIPGAATMQTQADLEKIEELKKVCPHLYVEMEPGDVLFLHCNTLHTSSPNESDMRRWAFVMCYNKKSNDSFKKHHHANYVPIEKVEDSAIKECNNYTDFSGKDFTNPIQKEEDRQHFPTGNK